MTPYVLGLDLGSNSVGWAMIAREDNTFDREKRILAGVRVFPMGLPKEKDAEGRATGEGIPPGRMRRQKRSERRQHRRRRQRRRKLARTLTEAGLLPKRDPELSQVLALHPYPLRKKGVRRQLTLHEFGRVLYHLSQRRGFRSNKKIAPKDAREAKDEKRTQRR
ncbi:MAG: type II CRISPR RNA-guided endonuclease Cas9 [Phycisphaerae bacterium]